MSFARVRLVLAAGVFLAWLGWLAVAVSQKGSVQIVSRAQLTAATTLVVGEVVLGADGTPSPRVKVVKVLAGEAAGEIDVGNLPSSATPLPVAGNSRTPQAGTYFLALVKGEGGYRIAGLPKSPGGYEATTPDRPLIYPWAEDVKQQLRTLKLLAE